MSEGRKINSALVQQLCRHITSLEETNAKLNQQLEETQKEKFFVFLFFGAESWKDLLSELQSKSRKAKVMESTSHTSCSPDYTFSSAHSPLSANRSRSAKKKSVYDDNQYDNNQENQSLIENESRIVNRSIRGDTDRNDLGRDFCENEDNYLSELNSEQRQAHDNEERDSMLLSIQNTKLRQRIAKLEAIIASQQYH